MGKGGAFKHPLITYNNNKKKKKNRKKEENGNLKQHTLIPTLAFFLPL